MQQQKRMEVGRSPNEEACSCCSLHFISAGRKWFGWAKVEMGGCTLGCWLGPLGGTYDEEDGHGEYSSLNCQFKLSGARSERGDGLNCCEGLNRIECGSRVVQ